MKMNSLHFDKLQKFDSPISEKQLLSSISETIDAPNMALDAKLLQLTELREKLAEQTETLAPESLIGFHQQLMVSIQQVAQRLQQITQSFKPNAVITSLEQNPQFMKSIEKIVVLTSSATLIEGNLSAESAGPLESQKKKLLDELGLVSVMQDIFQVFGEDGESFDFKEFSD